MKRKRKIIRSQIATTITITLYNEFVDIKQRYQIAASKSQSGKPTPPSEMIRVPTVLIPVVRYLSKLHRQGHTIALLQGLEALIAQFDSSIKLESTMELQQVEEQLLQIKTQLSQQGEGVETKLEAITKKLELIERALASGKYGGSRGRRSSGYPYQYHPIELDAFPHQNLAQRLGVTSQGLMNERESRTEEDFLSWSRHRDPMTVGWKYQAEDGLYYPIKQ